VIGTFHLSAQKTFKAGVILKKSDSSIINHVHIINTTLKIGVTTNQHGTYTIVSKPTDTLIISFVGFHSLKNIASEISSTIYLEREIYTIEPYTVLPYKDFHEFKEAFTNLELYVPVKHKINSSIMLLAQPFNPNNINGGLSFSGSISSLAALFNKRIKDRKNYEKLLQQDKYQTFIASKFNPNIIKQTTLLRDDTYINSFMEYCDFNDQYIEFSSQYNLFNQIIKCFDEYHSLPIADN